MGSGTPSATAVAVSCVKAIRRAIRHVLLDQTAAGSRVSTNRAERVWREGVPAIEVFVLGEDVEESMEAPREYKRSVRIAVEAFVEEHVDAAGVRMPADDQLDDLVAQVLGILTATHDACGTAADFFYDGAEYGWDAQGVQLVGAARLVFVAVFYETAGEDDELRALNLAHLEWDVQGSPTADPEAVDDITLGGG